MDHSSDAERRSGAERRATEDRRAGADRRRDREKAIARRIPDEFAQTGGSAGHRIAGLVSRHWPDLSPDVRSALAQKLAPILADLLTPGVPVTEKHRDRCEDTVLEWFESRQR